MQPNRNEDAKRWRCMCESMFVKEIKSNSFIAQSAGAIEYTDCTSAEE